MHRFTPCLTLLALAAVPAMAAEDFSLKLKGIIQARALFLNNADNATGGQYDPLRGQNGNAEHVRVGLRRVRLAAEATTSDGWFGNVTIRASEPNNLNGVTDTNGGARGIDLYYAYVGRRFKTGMIEHDLLMGMDKAFNGESSISSSTYLFPSDRVTASATDSQGSRNPGIFYKLNHEYVRWGVSVQNNTTNTAGGTNNALAHANSDKGEHNGVRYSTRIEGGLLPAKKQEAWAGTPGTHFVMGFDFAQNNDSYSADYRPSAAAVTTPVVGGGGGTVVTTPAVSESVPTRSTHRVLGPDLMIHLDGLSFLAEYRIVRTEAVNTKTSAGKTTNNRFASFVAGYAIPMETGVVFEPAVRYQTGDVEGRDKESNITANGEFGTAASGREIGLGLNTYWNGHKNKTQLAFTQASAAEGDAVARFVTLQHQVTF